MDVASIAGNANAVESANRKDVVENPKGVIDKDGFLKLLIAQLKYQDPLNPLNNDQFIQENTGFSQLEQLQNIKDSINDFSSKAGNNDKSYAADYLGKYIATGSEDITVGNAGIDTLSFNLPTNAAVHASILDSKGKNTADIDLGNLSKGSHTFNWDGKDNQGSSVSNGTYSVTLSAVDGSGKVIPIEKNAGKVIAVQFNTSGVVLVTNQNQSIKLADVKSVFEGGGGT